MKNVLESSFNQGIKRSQNLKEKPKYMLFSVLTVVVFDYTGWIGVVSWFFINFVVDYLLMKYKGEM